MALLQFQCSVTDSVWHYTRRYMWRSGVGGGNGGAGDWQFHPHLCSDNGRAERCQREQQCMHMIHVMASVLSRDNFAIQTRLAVHNLRAHEINVFSAAAVEVVVVIVMAKMRMEKELVPYYSTIWRIYLYRRIYWEPDDHHIIMVLSSSRRTPSTGTTTTATTMSLRRGSRSRSRTTMAWIAIWTWLVQFSFMKLTHFRSIR